MTSLPPGGPPGRWSVRREGTQTADWPGPSAHQQLDEFPQIPQAFLNHGREHWWRWQYRTKSPRGLERVVKNRWMPPPRESLCCLWLCPSTGHLLPSHPELDLGAASPGSRPSRWGLSVPGRPGPKQDLAPVWSHPSCEAWPLPSKREKRRDPGPEHRDQNGDSNSLACPQDSALITPTALASTPSQPQTRAQAPVPRPSVPGCLQVHSPSCPSSLLPPPSQLHQPPPALLQGSTHSYSRELIPAWAVPS